MDLVHVEPWRRGPSGRQGPPPTTLAHSGYSFWKAHLFQGLRWYCFLPISCCHLIGIPRGPWPFSAPTQSYLHLYLLPYKKQPEGDLHLDSCSRPGDVSLSVRAAPGHTRDLGRRESSVEIQAGRCQVSWGRSRRWTPLRPRPWRQEATPLHPHWSACCRLPHRVQEIA